MPLVSVCLPVRNCEDRVSDVVRAVLKQDHENLELIISDNASTDGTGEICRELAHEDARIVYHRQPENVGMLNNFITAMRLTTGTYLRWIGDDDSIAPANVSRCLEAFAADERLVLVTTQVSFIGPDGIERTAPYDGNGLSSDDPADRFAELLRLLNASYLLMDPLYGLMRRSAVVGIPRRNMLREDQIFAANIALAGPWAHVNEVLGRRGWTHDSGPPMTERLGLPAWHARIANVRQCRELLRCVRNADLDSGQRARARAAVGRLYVERQRQLVTRRSRKLVAMALRGGVVRG
ncbi:glycosyltransferase family 2 protein [Paractinoplanes globisporus]|uniref:Glycosyltransferase family 2 protein n=1 Tax=Paractinoplanes globisporus TaxID=113565 RepID=A0ABW6W9U3_9ACTN|nr:glycosyltransferase family 2 protein [Actinoplanes globisporus]